MPALTRMSAAQAAGVARARYGVTATAQRLESEHDDTFRLTLADGTARFLRASAPDPVAGGPSFLTAILSHLARTAADIPVQRVIPALDGAAEVLLDGRLVRMTTFLEGRLLRDVAPTPPLRRDIGATLARLSRALRDFTHPAAHRTHRWDLQNAAALRPLLDDVLMAAAAGAPGLPGVPQPVRGLLTQTLDRFGTVVHPALATAPVQVIHADFHGENLLVTQDGSAVGGILDFGDSLVGPVAMDVAVAACYQLGPPAGGSALLEPALEVVAGYHAVDPLRPADLPLIGELIALRLATRIIVSQWNAVREPSNSGYLLRRTTQAIEQFTAYRAIPPAAVAGRLREACGR